MLKLFLFLKKSYSLPFNNSGFLAFEFTNFDLKRINFNILRLDLIDKIIYI